MRNNLQDRVVLFAIEDGCLVRTVVGGDGPASSSPANVRTYTHRCTKEAFETVAHAIAETPAQGEGTSLAQVARREKLPFTQVNVAIEFLKGRGLIDVRHRRSYPATRDVYLDAMIEFYALAEEPKPANP